MSTIVGLYEAKKFIDEDQLDAWWAERGLSVDGMDASVAYMESLGLVRSVRTFGSRAPRSVSPTTAGIVFERAATAADLAIVKRDVATSLEGQEMMTPRTSADGTGGLPRLWLTVVVPDPAA